MSRRALSSAATLVAVLSAALVTPFGMAVAMLARAERARGVAVFLHPEDLLLGLRVTAAVILAAGAVLVLRRLTRRPIPLGPMLIVATLVGLQVAITYGLDPSRLQRQLGATESVRGVAIPSDEEFQARYGARAPIDFDNDQYLALVNEAIEWHNRELLRQAPSGQEPELVPLLVRQENLRDQVNRTATAGLAVMLLAVAAATLGRGLFLALVAEGWYLVILAGLAVQAATIVHNWPHRDQVGALIELGPWVTSPVALGLLVLGQAGYLAKVGAGVDAQGYWLRGAVPRIPMAALWPFWLPMGLSMAGYYFQRDLGSLAILLITAAVQVWVAFSPGRSTVLLTLGAVALAAIAVGVAQGWISADTARERFRMALGYDSYFRERRTLNTAVDAFWSLARNGGAPVPEQVAVVNRYLDGRYCGDQPWPSASPQERGQLIEGCVQDRQKMWAESLPTVERTPTRPEFETADGLWWYLQHSGLPQSMGLAEGLRLIEVRLAEAVHRDSAREYEQDNEQQLLVQALLNATRLFGHGLGNTEAGRVYNNDTDFPAAVVADQLGAAGFLFLVLALSSLVVVGVAAGVRAPTLVETLLATTAAGHLGAYILINLGGTLGLPSSGVPLPFLSRGGTFFVMDCLLVGIIMAVAASAGSPGWVEPRRRARRLIAGSTFGLPIPPVPLALLVFPAAAILLLTLVRPAFVPTSPEAGAGLPRSPWAPRPAPPAARIVALSAGGEVAVADLSADGNRIYPDAAGTAATDPCSLGRTLISLLGLPQGGPVPGVEQSYRQGDFGAPRPGSTVVLTIDAELQRTMCQEWLAVARERVQDGSELRGAFIVLETDTGALRALGSFPNLPWEDLEDPDRLRQRAYEEAFPPEGTSPSLPLLNRALRLLTTPGSVAKLITAVCGIEAGVVEERSVLEDSGDITVDGVRIRHDNIPAQLQEVQERWSLFEALAWSLNGAFGRVAAGVNSERYLACVRRLGVITRPEESPPTPFLLPHELAQLSARDIGRPFGLITAGYGQGSWLMSPLHLAILYAGVDRGGSLPRVHVVEGLRGEDRSFTLAPDATPAEWLRGWSERTNALLARGLVQSATPGQGWAGKNAPLLVRRTGHLPTGAKTGTAELRTGGPPHQSWVAVVSPVGAAHGLSCVVVIEHGGEGATGALQVVDRTFARVDVNALLARTARP